jgi:hypothetical protein
MAAAIAQDVSQKKPTSNFVSQLPQRDSPTSYRAPSYSAPAPTYKSAPTYKPAPTYKEPTYESDAKYNYAYEVKANNDYHGNVDFGHSESRDGCSTSGKYSVLLPDGRVQTVTYTADCYAGYNADVSYAGEAKPYAYKKPVYKPAPQYKPAPSYKPAPKYKPTPAPQYKPAPSSKTPKYKPAPSYKPAPKYKSTPTPQYKLTPSNKPAPKHKPGVYPNGYDATKKA